MLQWKAQSTALIATLTDAQKSREFERTLTVKKIVDNALPITEMHRHVGARAIAVAIDIALTRLVASLNLKWNINDNQVKIIVEDLIDKYENESIEDFVLCFKKARLGEYGEIMRLDSAVLCGWMTKYLDEKYQVLETKLVQEKDNQYEKPSQITEEPGYQEFKRWAKEFVSGAKIPAISDEDIKAEGQRHPKPKKGHFYPIGTQEALDRIDLKAKYGREHTDIITGKPLPGSPTFDQWIETQI